MSTNDLQLMAHLMRRAGFGASREELEALVEQGYDETVKKLLETDSPNSMDVDLIRRYHPDHMGMMGNNVGSHWMYRMISTDSPLREKTALFWHGIFATGYAKLANGKVLHDQIRMFARVGMGKFDNILLELSKDPAMIVWLDNCENHDGAINENYGRELLELFSMGVGHYSEDDIKEAARAFTGWTIGNTDYMTLKSMRDSIWPYGRLSFHFEFKPDDHDTGEKEFLGRKGNFDGGDIIDIICEEEATARFIARHMYSYFVADEPPVPEWPYKPPRDPEAIETLTRAYFDGGYSIKEMLRTLLTSDFFKSEDVWYQRVKSPAELMVGVLKLSGEFPHPREEMIQTHLHTVFMGQHLMNPPSVEGWHWGTGWIDSGALVERVNFASERLSNLESPGVQSMVDGVLSNDDGADPADLVDRALEQLSLTEVTEVTRKSLIEFVERSDEMADDNGGQTARERAANALKLVAATPEFQRA